ncbi:MAG: pantoate--beta-alanine ligase [Candidatus Omnitrophica bacterium]|nr:pantoate--beta-alanine ligase [Candidatus Omnitrophota bacterium]
MRIIRSIPEMQKICAALKRKGRTIGFVPTMGALHKGHLSLIQQARKDNRTIVVSIFVNPIQFALHEDLKAYPRPFKKDIPLLQKENVDFLFYPQAEKMYPENFRTSVEVKVMGKVLCGVSRPDHFCGVATVVTKLFNIIQPDAAYFGQKDAQQATIIRRMADDLNMPFKIKVMPTVRDTDGLALSSRNVYLNSQERQDSLVLSKALGLARELIRHGQRNALCVINRMKALIRTKKTAKIGYIAIVDSRTLNPVKIVGNNCLICLAVRFGKTRLIDNLLTRGE